MSVRTMPKKPPVLWGQLHMVACLSVDDILDTTYRSGKGVSELVVFLDQTSYQGLLKDFASRCLEKTAKPLLERDLTLDSDAMKVLSDPRGFFGVVDDQTARDKTVEYFADRVNGNSLASTKRAMIAFVEFGLCQFFGAINNAHFAWCENELSEFGRHLDAGTDEALEVLVRSEEIQAEQLIRLVRK